MKKLSSKLSTSIIKPFFSTWKIRAFIPLCGKTTRNPRRTTLKSNLRHGGLIEPMVVLRDTLEVIEGNSRLAAYRILAEKDPVKWQKAKCHILPAKINASLISRL